MRFVALAITLLLTACSVQLTDSALNAFFDGQRGRWLPIAETSGCEAVLIAENLVEYVPKELPKSGWAVVWRVDTSTLPEINAQSGEPTAGRIIAWRIIGDRSKVRIPLSFGAG